MVVWPSERREIIVVGAHHKMPATTQLWRVIYGVVLIALRWHNGPKCDAGIKIGRMCMNEKWCDPAMAYT